jgi:hypothetical protein
MNKILKVIKVLAVGSIVIILCFVGLFKFGFTQERTALTVVDESTYLYQGVGLAGTSSIAFLVANVDFAGRDMDFAGQSLCIVTPSMIGDMTVGTVLYADIFIARWNGKIYRCEAEEFGFLPFAHS